MKRIAQRTVAFAMAALLMANTAVGSAQTITYTPSTGTVSYESSHTAQQESRLFTGIFDSFTGALEQVAQTILHKDEALTATLEGFTGAVDPSQHDVKIFHLDASSLEPLGDPLFEGTLEDITLNQVELKDIQDVKLYQSVNGVATHVYELDEAHLGDYLVRLEMRNQPVTYAPIRAYDSAARDITLDLPNTVTRGADGKLLDRAVVHLDVPRLDTLLKEIAANPDATYTLGADLDASMYLPENTPNGAFVPVFTGTLDGNGYTIKNLKVPLFTSTNGATIKNLVIEGAEINEGAGQPNRTRIGVIAMSTTGGTLENVHLKNVEIRPKSSANKDVLVGGLVGLANKTNFAGCSVTGIKLTVSGNECGALVGQMPEGRITDCYAQGTIGTITINTNYTRIGGLLGQAVATDNTPRVSVQRSIANVRITTGNIGTDGDLYSGPSVGGLVGGNVNITDSYNNLVLGGVEGNGFKFATPKGQKKYTNSFELDTAPGIASTTGGITAVTQATLTSGTFFGTTLGLSGAVWDLEAMEQTGVPALRGASRVRAAFSGGTARTPAAGAPRAAATQQQLYTNLSRLMPFTTDEQLMALGQGADASHILNQKAIAGLLPLADGRYPSGITRENFGTVNELLVSFTDQTQTVLSLSRPKLTDFGAPSYWIDELGTYYVGNFYAADSKSTVCSAVSGAVAGMNYERDLLPLVGGRDVTNQYVYQGKSAPSDRNMLDETAEKVLDEGEDFALKLLSSGTGGYNANVGHPLLEQVVQTTLMSKLTSYLYSYIYYRTWYNLDFTFAYLPEVMFFRGSFYDPAFTLPSATAAVIAATRDQRTSHQTSIFYSNRLAERTKLATLGDFLDYSISTFSNGTAPADWFEQNFKGMLIEGAIEGLDVDVRVYNKMKVGPYQQMLLPAISMDNTDLYFLSVPSQLMYGSMTGYINDPSDPAQRAGFRRTAEAMRASLLRYYKNSSAMIENSTQLLRKSNKTGVDSFFENGKGWVLPPLSTSPAKKFFCQAIKTTINFDGSPGRAGYSDGGSTFYIVNGNILSMFSLFSHENVHNQDGEYFLGGYGYRVYEPELFTEGVFSQPPGGNDTGITFMGNDGPTADTSTPLKAENINSNEKSQRYYERFYEAMYTIDLIEAEAMLSLPSEVQQKLVFRYTLNPDSDKQRVQWKQIPSVAEYEALNLQTYADFSKHHLNITRDEVENGFVDTEGRYLRPTFLGASLATPYNTRGIPDWRTFKRFGNELMALKGYSGGYIPWMSAQVKPSNDLAILRFVTGDRAMTFERFDAEKHTKILDKYQQNGSDYFDWDQCVEWFRNAYLMDYACGKDAISSKPYSGAVKVALLRQFSRTTGDYETSIYAPRTVIEVSDAQGLAAALQSNAMQVIRLVGDIDFSGYTYTGDSVVTNTYVGGLDGNGHSIRNLERPLFDQLAFSVVENLRLENAQISLNGNGVGALARGAKKCSFLNVHVAQGTSVSGNGNVGGLLGTDQGSLFDSISVNAAVTARGSNAGGLAATLNQSTVTNCYTAGSLAVSGGHGGGLAGMIERSVIHCCYSAMGISLRGSAVGGSLIGLCKRITHTNSLNIKTNYDNRVTNSIALGGGINVRKVDGATPTDQLLSTYQNCYELEMAPGISASAELGSGAFTSIISATDALISSVAFYQDTLSFPTGKWILDEVTTGAAPKLNTPLDTNANAPQTVISIGTLDELLSIRQNPDASYQLTANIDATTYIGDAPLVPAFGGRLLGEGFAIQNLKQPLFGALSGTVEQLTLQNAAITVVDGEDVGALAKTANGASLLKLTMDTVAVTGSKRVGGIFGSANATVMNDVRVNSITVTGSEHVGGLVGSDVGSTVSRVVANGITVNGKTRVGGLLGSADGTSASLVSGGVTVTGQTGGSAQGGAIGAMSGGSTLTNTYLSGIVSAYGVNNGGVVGYAQNGSCTAVFANVEFGRKSNSSDFNGGFVGKWDSGSLTNCISVGNTSGSPLPNKLAGSDAYNSRLSSCYQYGPASGMNHASGAKTATELDRKNPIFYTGSLKWSGEVWDFTNVATGTDPVLSFVNDPGPGPDPGPEAKYAIHSLEDFMSMRYDMDGDYTLEADLNLKGILTSAVLMGGFTGTFDGKGHSITGAERPLFESVQGGSVSNLVLTGMNVAQAGDQIGLLAKTSANGTFHNIHAYKATLSGAGNIGGLIGADSGSTISSCSVNITLSAKGDKAGLLVGAAQNSRISDCYTMGSLTSNGNFAGGLVGVAEGAVVSQCYSIATVKETNAAYTAGTLIGGVSGTADIQKCLSFGGGERVRAIDGNSDPALMMQSYQSCYEYTEAAAQSLCDVLTAVESTQTRVQKMGSGDAANMSFYTALDFQDATWDLRFVVYSQLPTLLGGLDTNVPALGESNVITSLQSLMNIKNNLNGTYVLGADIDLGEYTDGSTSSGGVVPIIPGIFNGTLEGGGYKLYNSTAPVFDEVRGTVSNLRLEDFKLLNIWHGSTGVLAQVLNGATVTRIELNRIQMLVPGRGTHIGSLCGWAKGQSKLSEISATEVNISGDMESGGGLIGMIEDSILEHVYVQGTISIYLDEAGGLAGNSKDAEIYAAFVDVDVTDSKVESEEVPTDLQESAGFVARASGIFENCISVGNVIGGRTFIYQIQTGGALECDGNYYRATATGDANPGDVAVGPATDEQLRTPTFYLGRWYDSIWDMSNVATDGRPTLIFAKAATAEVPVPVAEPSEPEVGPSEPEVGPSEPEAGPSEPEVGPSEPEVGPSEPEVGPSEPEVGPSEPEVGPSEPEAGPSEPLLPEQGGADAAPPEEEDNGAQDSADTTEP